MAVHGEQQPEVTRLTEAETPGMPVTDEAVTDSRELVQQTDSGDNVVDKFRSRYPLAIVEALGQHRSHADDPYRMPEDVLGEDGVFVD